MILLSRHARRRPPLLMGCDLLNAMTPLLQSPVIQRPSSPSANEAQFYMVAPSRRTNRWHFSSSGKTRSCECLVAGDWCLGARNRLSSIARMR